MMDKGSEYLGKARSNGTKSPSNASNGHLTDESASDDEHGGPPATRGRPAGRTASTASSDVPPVSVAFFFPADVGMRVGADYQANIPDFEAGERAFFFCFSRESCRPRRVREMPGNARGRLRTTPLDDGVDRSRTVADHRGDPPATLAAERGCRGAGKPPSSGRPATGFGALACVFVRARASMLSPIRGEIQMSASRQSIVVFRTALNAVILFWADIAI